jgi:hypothetical protein
MVPAVLIGSLVVAAGSVAAFAIGRRRRAHALEAEPALELAA